MGTSYALPAASGRREVSLKEIFLSLIRQGMDACPYVTLSALLLLLGFGTLAALYTAAMAIVYPLTILAALL